MSTIEAANLGASPVRSRARKWTLLVVILAAAAAAGAGVWALWPGPPERRARDEESPYLNTRAGVKYVGDKACVQCHGGIVEQYHEGHSMGHSMVDVSTASLPEKPAPDAKISFDKPHGHYEVRKAGKKVYHKEVFRAGGESLATFEEEIDLAMGSGHSGRSFLIVRDGWVFQSPISWYTHRKGEVVTKPSSWDLSPGFEHSHAHFTRPVMHECLFCHCDVVTPLKDAVNRYEQPLFKRQQSIGCERCHGPGELHVASRRRGNNPDDDMTIVNPAKLTPNLREAICQQCHLQGESRIARRGKSMLDFRPGLPLHKFLTVFVKAPQFSDKLKAVSHMEQMHSSRCFLATKGRASQLGCLSCHGPHHVPEPEERVASYRSACLSCHQDNSCHLTKTERISKRADDSCVACHMPAAKASNIVHAAVTDHRILRNPDNAPQPKAEIQWPNVPLVHFHRDIVGEREEGIERDLGLALVEWRRLRKPESGSGPGMTEIALAFLEEASREDPDDVEAREAYAYALRSQGRTLDAWDVLEDLLTKVPEREQSLQDIVVLAPAVGKAQEGLDYCRRLVKASPRRPDYHLAVALVHASMNQWKPCAQECEKALRLSPTNSGARFLLIRCYFRMGDKDKAQREYKRILAIAPRAPPQEVRDWFNSEMSR